MRESEKNQIRAWIHELAVRAGESAEFEMLFTDELLKDEEIREEFVSYMETGDFLCKAKIDGYTVIDIMVWQMDHFKAQMDRGRTEMRQNAGKMLLRAFDTMLKMKENPQKYKELMQSETGTDYPEKYGQGFRNR